MDELEKEMLFFYQQRHFSFIGQININKSINLLSNYKLTVDSIALKTYPALSVITGSLNRFFCFFIRSLRKRFEIFDKNLWKDLDKLIELIEIVEMQAKSINELNLWRHMNLMKHVMDLLEHVFLVNDLKTIKETKLKLDSLCMLEEGEKINIYQVEVIKEFLFPKFIEVFLNKEISLKEFNELLNEVLNSNVANRDTKDVFMFQLCKKLNVKKEVKVTPLSKIGIINKYKVFLKSSKLNENSKFEDILDEIFSLKGYYSEEIILEMFDKLIYLIETSNDIQWSSQELLSSYRKLSNEKFHRPFSLNFVSRYEYTLSKKIEDLFIYGNKNVRNSGEDGEVLEDFDRMLKIVLRDRILEVHKVSDLIRRKFAFYSKLIELLERNPSIHKVLYLLASAKAQMENRNVMPFTDDETKFLENYFKINQLKERIPEEIFETIIFNLSELQSELILQQLNEDGKIDDEKAKKSLESELNEKMMKIKTFSMHENAVFKGLWAYVNQIETRTSNKTFTEIIVKALQLKKENFIGKVKTIFDNKANEMSQERIFGILKNALNEKFENWTEKNKFILGALKAHDSSLDSNKSNYDFFYKLIDLIDLNELIAKEEYKEMLEYIEEIDKIQKYKDKIQIIKDNVERSFSELAQRIINELSLLFEKSSNLNVLAATKIMIHAVEGKIELGINIEIFLFLKELSRLLSVYKIESQINSPKKETQKNSKDNKLEETSTVEKKENSEEKKSEEKDQFSNKFIKKVIELFQVQIMKISKLSEVVDDLVYDALEYVLSQIKENNFDGMERLIEDYIYYLQLRIIMNSESLQTHKIELIVKRLIQSFKCIRCTLISNGILKLTEKLAKILNLEFSERLMKYIERFYEIIETKKNECELTKEEIINVYKSKLDTKNDLVNKGKSKFILNLIAKYHNMKNDRCVFKLHTMYQELKKDIGQKSSSKEIEDYMIDLYNDHTLKHLIPKLFENYKDTDEKFNVYNSRFLKDPSLHTLSNILFSENQQKNSNCLTSDLIKLISEDKKGDKFEIINKYFDFLQVVMKNVYFNSYDEQNEIQIVSDELDENVEKYKKIKDLTEKGKSLNDILSDSCYKINHFIKHIDREPILFDLVQFNHDFSTILTSVETVFEKYDFIYMIDFEKTFSAANIEFKSKHDFVQNLIKMLKSLIDRLNVVLQSKTPDTTDIFNEITKSLNSCENFGKELLNNLDEIIKSCLEENLIGKIFLDLKQKQNEILIDEAKEYVKKIIDSNKDSHLMNQISRDLLNKSENMMIEVFKSYILSKLCLLNAEEKPINKKIALQIFSIIKLLSTKALDTNNFTAILKAYLAYSDFLRDLDRITMDKLDLKGIEVISTIFKNEENRPDFVDILLEKIASIQIPITLDYLNELIESITLAISFLSKKKFNINKMKHAIEKILPKLKQKPVFNNFLSLLHLLITHLYNCLNMNENKECSNELVFRILLYIDKSTNDFSEHNIAKDLSDEFIECCKVFLMSDTKSHQDLVYLLFEKFGYQWFMKNILKDLERKYCEILGDSKAKRILIENKLHICNDLLENEFISHTSEMWLEKERKILLPLVCKEELNNLIMSTYFDQATLSYSNIDKSYVITKNNKKLLKLVLMIKYYIFQSKELIKDKLKWIELVEIVKDRKVSDSISLQDSAHILYYSRLFDNEIEPFILLMKEKTETNFSKKIQITLLAKMLSKISKSQNEDFSEILEKIDKQLQWKNNDFLKLLLKKLAKDYSIGMKYEKSEVFLLKQIISLCLSLRLYAEAKDSELFKCLKTVKILKWESILKVKKTKYELGRGDDKEVDELAMDLLIIEKNKGVHLTQKFKNIIKNKEINNLQLKYIVKKFKKNIYELNCKIIDTVLAVYEPSEWIEQLNKFDESEKQKPLSVQDLVTLMKQLEGSDEINSHIKHLLNRTDELSLIEKSIKKIDEIYEEEAIVISIPRITISKYEEKDIEMWTREFKKLDNKIRIKSIDDNAILELVAVLSRGSEIIYGYQLRPTQKISLLIFIDRILQKGKGRLANISTGEGKSIITITTTIAQLLINGGTVDILTSSEVLAERDAEESKEMFNLFKIKVSNNCDLKAIAEESTRKKRYEKNSVIYGEIGHFQRDLFLTKYYNKNIRKSLATCLIIDEVDSMCIDNICNTLYISHQIGDLRELKDIYVYIWQAVNTPGTSSYNTRNVEEVKKYIEKLIQNKQIVYPCNLDEFVNRRLKTWINNAYMAKLFIEEGNHYSVLESGKQVGQTVINDLQTGVEQMNTQWSEGLQQFIHLKHTNKLCEESLKAIFMSNYIFFKQYGSNIYGMTGTLGAKLEMDLLSNAYSLDFYQLPRFKKELNIREEPVLLDNRSDWLLQIQNEVNLMISENRLVDENEIAESKTKLNLLENELSDLKAQLNSKKEDESTKHEPLDETLHKGKLKREKKIENLELEIEDRNDVIGKDSTRNRGGRAVLIICENKKDVNDIVKTLLIKNKHLYDYNGKVDGIRKVESGNKRTHIKEIRQLRPGDIIVATNVAGRGTDFKLSPLLLKNGGMHVILSYVPNNIRVELQGFGRSGRKGEQGSGRMIVYDQRAKQPSFNYQFLIDERDEKEEERLQEIRIKMIPRVELERDLFQKFEILQENCKIYFEIKDLKDKYKELQMKSLHNKWAFWLDEMSNVINNVYVSENNKNKVFDEYDIFELKIINMLKERENACNGIEGFIDEPSELIKLAKYNIEEGNFSLALLNCDRVLNDFKMNMNGFAYYYKAIATFRPVKPSDLKETFESLRKKWNGHEITHEDKVQGVALLKKAIYSFEKEIEKIQMRSIILVNIGKDKRNSGIGTALDYFSKSNSNEISVIYVHLNAAKSCITQELNVEELAKKINNTSLTEDESKEIFEAILKNMTERIKKERISRKIKVKFVISKKEKGSLKEILENNPYYKSLAQKELESPEEGDLIIENISDYEKNLMEKKGIDYTLELFVKDLLDGTYKLVDFPKSFNYCKLKFLVNMKDAENKCSKDREIILNDCIRNSLSKEKIFKLIKEKIKIIPIQTIVLHKEHKNLLENRKFWDDFNVFEEFGEEIKTNLLKLLEKADSVIDYKEFKNSLPESLRPKCDEIRKNLENEKFLESKNMFQFNEETQNKIEELREVIVIKNKSKLETLDLKGFEQLNKHKSEILNILRKTEINSRVNKSEIIKILSKEQSEDDNNDTDYHFFRKYLSILGVSRNSIDELSINENLDSNEITELDGIIEQLHLEKYFTIDSIEILPVNSLIDELKKQKVIKGPNFHIKLVKGINWESFIEIFEEEVKNQCEKEVRAIIKKKIAENTFITASEIEEHTKGIKNKLSFACRTGANLIKSPIKTIKEIDNEDDYIKTDLIQTKTEKELKILTEIILQTLMDTIGSLKRFKRSMVNTLPLEDYFKGVNMPKEAFEYSNLHKNLVITISEYQSFRCWNKAFAIAVFGVLQITAGALLMAYPILGPLSYHLGSGLISEGASDITFAITNAGNIAFKSYMTHKIWSVLITTVTVGVGACLSTGANAAVIIGDIGKEQAARIGIKIAGKKVAREVTKMLLKKIAGEVGKTVLNLLKSKAIEKFSELITDTIFKQLPNVIMLMIKISYGYVNGLSKLRQCLEDIEKQIKKSRAENQQTINILLEKISESEQELSQSLNNKITDHIDKIGGPLSSQIYEAAQNIKYSGLKMNNGKLENIQMDKLMNIATIIETIITWAKHLNTVYNLVSVINKLLELINKKLSLKAESLTKVSKKTQSIINNQNQSSSQAAVQREQEYTVVREVSNPKYQQVRKYEKEDEGKDNEVEKSELIEATINVGNQSNGNDDINNNEEVVNSGIEIVNERLLQNIQNKVRTQIVSPTFNLLVDHVLKPLNEKLEEAFFQDFNDFKTRALAYGEYDFRYEENRQEKGVEMDEVKDYLISELSELRFKSPVLEVDLKDVKTGKIQIEIDGEMKILDLEKEVDRNLIRDKIGSIKIRILPGNKDSGGVLRLSRPNYVNYVKSWTHDKQVNETDLAMIAEREGRPFIIMTENGPKMIGSKGDKEPFILKFEKEAGQNTGHYTPMTMQDGKLVGVNDLKNNGNARGIESLIFLKERERLIDESKKTNSNIDLKKIDEQARANVSLDNVQKELNSIKDFAFNSPNMKSLFLNRSHEASDTLIGGNKRHILNKNNKTDSYDGNKKQEKLVETHVKERIENFMKVAHLVQELKKLGQEVEIEDAAYFQDYSGKHGRDAKVDSSSFKNCSNDIKDITSLESNKFSHIDAAHKVGFNIKVLNSTGHESADAQNVKKELIKTLASTTPLPKFVNTGAEKMIDDAQRAMAYKLQNTNKVERNDYIKTCNDKINERITELNSKTNKDKYKNEMRVLKVYEKELNRKNHIKV